MYLLCLEPLLPLAWAATTSSRRPLRKRKEPHATPASPLHTVPLPSLYYRSKSTLPLLPSTAAASRLPSITLTPTPGCVDEKQTASELPSFRATLRNRNKSRSSSTTAPRIQQLFHQFALYDWPPSRSIFRIGKAFFTSEPVTCCLPDAHCLSATACIHLIVWANPSTGMYLSVCLYSAFLTALGRVASSSMSFLTCQASTIITHMQQNPLRHCNFCTDTY